jgi:putative transposase
MVDSMAAGGATMADLFWLTKAQIHRITPYFLLSHEVPRVDDQRVVSGILHVIRNGLRWRDAPADYGPHKTLYNRFVRWSRMGVFNRIFAGLAGRAGEPDRLMIDATHLKAHRTAASLLKKGLFPPYRAHQRRPLLQAARPLRWSGADP